MPPRHTKSEFASVYFLSRLMGRNPKDPVYTKAIKQRVGR